MIISLKQREIKFKPRIKLDHNIYLTGQDYIQVKIFQSRLILKYLCLLAQENQPRLKNFNLNIILTCSMCIRPWQGRG